ncbi:tyrosine-type recombinase/integrase [Enterococcus faecium]|uniref:tyrosine-type recombinase/integrase n=1 Tax=Enterococcus faecium TaxID=1352 RepID=UPI00046E3A82|nr:tyrosine-type recombinase/integrase [Enterococcus faecium]EME7167363.1 tyrosine-type recombinase/integrase [Enterococcus faecium]
MTKLNWSQKYKHVFSYTNKKGEFWGYRYPFYNSLGQRKEASKRGFDSERAANKALLKIQYELETQHSSFIENKNITVNEWVKIWIPYVQDNWSVSTKNNIESAIKFHILPLIGNQKLSSLNKITYKREFIDKLRQKNKYKESTIQTWHKIVMRMINAAVHNQIIPSNTLTGFKFDLSNNVRSFSKKELQRFMIVLENKDIRTQVIFLTLLKSGMRKGELMGLRWNDINLTDKYFDINSTRGDYGENRPKTKTSIRKVYFDDSLLTLIKKYKYYEKERLLKKGRILKGEDYFILSSRNLPIQQSKITYIFRLLCEEAKVPNITVHGLRHTHATFLIEAGANIKYVSNRLGHKNINITLDVYSDVLKEEEKETADMMGKLIDNL